MSELDADNARAWRLAPVMCNRFTGDTQSAGIVLDRLTADLDAEGFSELMQRLTMIYDELNPPPAKD